MLVWTGLVEHGGRLQLVVDSVFLHGQSCAIIWLPQSEASGFQSDGFASQLGHAGKFDFADREGCSVPILAPFFGRNREDSVMELTSSPVDATWMLNSATVDHTGDPSSFVCFRSRLSQGICANLRN